MRLYDSWLDRAPYLFACVFFVAGLFGLGFGLPLHLVGDEESLIGGALKMASTGLFLPAVDQAQFATLYYATLLPWLYLAALLPYAAFVYVGVPAVGSMTDLAEYLAVHLDIIWVIARSVSLVAGALLIVVVHKLAKVFFPNQRSIALIAAYLMMTSLLHLQLSLVARHWVFTALFFALSLYYLMRSEFRERRDGLLAGLWAGLAFGISVTGFVVTFFICALYVFFSWIAHKTRLGLTATGFWWFVGTVAVLALFFIASHPGAYAFILMGEETPSHVVKGFSYISTELGYAVYYLLSSELIIALLAVGGVVLLVIRRHWRLAVSSIGILVGYNLFLVFFYHNAPRYHFFVMPLLCVLAASAAATFAGFLARRTKPWLGMAFLVMVLAVPAMIFARYLWLNMQTSTEQQAYGWIQKQLRHETFLVQSISLQVPQDTEFMDLQETKGRVPAQLRALRDIEGAPTEFTKYRYTNLHFWDADARTADAIREFLDTYRAQYFILSFERPEELEDALTSCLIGQSELVTSYSNSDTGSVDGWGLEPFSDLGVGQWKLFSIRRFGHYVQVYSLPEEWDTTVCTLV